MIFTIPLPILLQLGGLALLSLFGADYLFPQPVEAPNAPDTIRLPNPLVPFTGGQCSGVSYTVTARCNISISSNPDFRNYDASLTVLGAVSRVEMTYYPPSSGKDPFNRHTFWFEVDGSGGTSELGLAAFGESEPIEGWTWTARDIVVTRSDSLPDTCGNKDELPIPESGAADTIINFDSTTFNDNSTTIFEGNQYDNDTTANIFNDASNLATEAIAALPVAVPSGLIKVVEMLSKVVDALKLMDEVLRLLRELLGKDNKSVRMFPYGRISGDGFSRLYPTGNPTEYEGISVELVALEIPSERGKIFGENSPNRYKYEPLGRIMFTSGSLGVISTHEIEYPRVSFPIPSHATGFFYHLGLHGNVAFNAVGVYYRIERSMGG